MLGVGASKKTYLDDVFSTFVYKGNNTARSINNGVNLSGEGGMVWTKIRNQSYYGPIADTERGIVNGATKVLSPSSSDAQGDYANTSGNQGITSFNSNGYSLGADGSSAVYNSNNNTFTSWTFRKAPGFFTCLTYVGNGTAGRQISHDLKSKPGFILIKRTDGAAKWIVYHHDTGASKSANLNNTNAFETDTYSFNQTEPTSTNFTLGEYYTNVNNEEYVAYLFAGGESTAATARSVDFDGSNDGLTVPNSSDFSFGSGDFTVEGWVKLDQNTNQNALVGVWRYQNGRRSWTIQTDNSTRKLEFYVNSGGGTVTNHETSGGTVPVGQWFHFAGVRHGNTIKLFINGNKVAETAYTSSLYDNTNDPLIIGNQSFGTDYTDGKISNIRITKGQALYTTSFKVPTEPLTTTSQGATASNVKLLCCNNSSVTGSTVTPTTISNTGSTASTDSPFDDPAGFVFGDNKEGIIKCGSYVGDGNGGSSQGVANSQEIYLGFEPQWILIKRSSAAEGWMLYDSMRGIVANDGNDDKRFEANFNDAEASVNHIQLTSRGFTFTTNNNTVNADGDSYIFCAIRRPDGYVGKPAEAGTDVFAMDTGSSSSTIPNFDSGFPVDFAFFRKPAANGHWELGARLIQGKFHYTDDSDAEMTWANMAFDSNVGWEYSSNHDSAFQSWMFKRHAGMDVVTYKGDHVDNRQLPHQLSKAPEMIWTHARDTTENWVVWHTGMPNSGDGENATAHALLNLNNGVSHSGQIYGGTDAVAPTSTHWSVGTHESINDDRYNYLSMLFTSVSGISKVGYYTGNGSSQTITVGFQPRFLILKVASTTENWYVLDTTRGWGSGNDKFLILNNNSAQGNSDFGQPTSTGFTVVGSDDWDNANGETYIYYAHA